jgi:hypothetical protein
MNQEDKKILKFAFSLASIILSIVSFISLILSFPVFNRFYYIFIFILILVSIFLAILSLIIIKKNNILFSNQYSIIGIVISSLVLIFFIILFIFVITGQFLTLD